MVPAGVLVAELERRRRPVVAPSGILHGDLDGGSIGLLDDLIGGPDAEQYQLRALLFRIGTDVLTGRPTTRYEAVARHLLAD